MKAKIRIPTHEYAFIEVDIDGTEDEIVATHDRIMNMCRERTGLTQKEWAKFRNDYINKGEIDNEKWELLSKAQKFVINEIKLALRSNNGEI